MNLLRHLINGALTLYLGIVSGFAQQAHAFVVSDPVPDRRLEINLPLPTEAIETIGFGVTSWNELAETALTRWNDVGIGPLPDDEFFSVRDRSVPRDPCVRDGINTVNFRDQLCGGFGWGDALGVTTSRFTTGGPVVEVDVIFNGAIIWDAYTGPLRRRATGGIVTEFLRVALHEFGHALGLDHPDEFGQRVQALMNSFASDIDSIQPDDEAGARAIPFIPGDNRGGDQRDLTVSFVKVKHVSKDDGDNITVKVSIQYIGTTMPNDPIRVSLFRSEDDALDGTDELIATTETLSVPSRSGEEVAAKLKAKGVPSLAGSFVVVSVDGDDLIDELNESNNVIAHRLLGRGCGKDTFVPENEPNDVPATNQGGIGKIRPGQCIRIEGIGNSFNADFDGYHFFPVGGQQLEFTLTHDAATDFDLLFFDFQDTAAPLLSCEAAITPEVCSVGLAGNPDGTQRFDIVVVPISGIGAYTLDIFSQE